MALRLLYIKSEAIANDHIEPYVLPAINANLSILDKEEYPMAKELDTQVDGILDMILDEWQLRIVKR